MMEGMVCPFFFIIKFPNLIVNYNIIKLVEMESPFLVLYFEYLLIFGI